MSKMKLALEVVEDLRNLADSIETLTRAMEIDPFPEEKEEPKPIAIEKVRAVLAAKSKEGKAQIIKELITKYGGSKLTQIDPAYYGDLLQEADAL